MLGDKSDLSAFPDNHFDLIFHPVSNIFVPEILLVWRECYRGCCNGRRAYGRFYDPLVYIYDFEKLIQANLSSQKTAVRRCYRPFSRAAKKITRSCENPLRVKSLAWTSRLAVDWQPALS